MNMTVAELIEKFRKNEAIIERTSTDKGSISVGAGNELAIKWTT